MKTILFLFSFMFVSCVTANPENRDLSGVKEKPEQNQTTIEDINRPLMLADDEEDCMIDCIANGGSTHGCSCVCTSDGCRYSQSPTESKKPLMLAVDYDTCVKGCIGDGGSFWECHRVCEE